MDEEYDVIVLGTGFVECVLSGLLSVDGKKVLHMDRNDYYGGASASLNLKQLWEKFGREGEPVEAKFGRSRDYNVDLVPKLIMSAGVLVKLLLHTDVTRYLEFKSIEGSYVYKKGQIFKVPVTETEALSTSLLGMFEKKRFRDFLIFVQKYSDADKKDFNVDTQPMSALFAKYKLDSQVQDFVGHALALYQDDEYLDRPARECMDRISLYADSLARHGKSPYIYPLYGLGELPQGFARLAAIYGGTYMLNKKVDDIIYNTDGSFAGVKCGDEVAKAKIVIGDPSYFLKQGKVEKKGQVVRCICLLSHPVPNTNNVQSLQIIIPQSQVGRKKDIYVAVVSFGHNVAPKDKYIAIVSTIVETANPQAEVEPGLKLLGAIDEKFYDVVDLYSPTNNADTDKTYISNSYDSTSHFETASNNILELYRKITGKDIQFKEPPQGEGDTEGDEKPIRAASSDTSTNNSIIANSAATHSSGSVVAGATSATATGVPNLGPALPLSPRPPPPAPTTPGTPRKNAKAKAAGPLIVVSSSSSSTTAATGSAAPPVAVGSPAVSAVAAAASQSSGAAVAGASSSGAVASSSGAGGAVDEVRRATAVEWSLAHEWLAIAGADGSLNILRLQWVPGKNHHGAQLAAGLGVHFKQACDGHAGVVQLSPWNDVFEKIASYDLEGTIIVWQRVGARFAKVEVTHRRSGSVATAFTWSPDGQLSCIAYKDGLIAVCSAAGQLWTRHMPGVAFAWAPGTRALAASLRAEGRVRLYGTHDGALLTEVPVVSREEELEIVDMQWFTGVDGVESDAPSLAVCFANGLVQIFENERDEVPVLIETQMRIVTARWSPDGRLLAIAGVSFADGLNVFVNEYSHVNSSVQFYTADGKLVVQQVVMSPDICALSWHRSAMQLAVATPHAVSLYVVRRGKVTGVGATPSYFGGLLRAHVNANAVADAANAANASSSSSSSSSSSTYGGDNGGRWRCVALRGRRRRNDVGDSAVAAPAPDDDVCRTIVYTPCTAINGDVLTSLVFWQTDTAHVIVKTLAAGVDLIAMEAHGELCVVATANRTPSDGVEYKLSLWNAEGVCTRTKAIEIEPVHMSVTRHLVCVASREVLCLWDHSSSFSSEENPFQTEIQYLLLQSHNNNPIVSMDASDKLVVIGRKNGLLHVLHLPALRKETKHKLDATAAFISINCDSTRAAIIDHRGNLKILTLAPGDTVIQTEFLIDSKDVWDFAWSRTEPLRFAVTEKNRTHTFADQSHEDCIVNAAQIVDFGGDQIVAVQFDRLLAEPMRPPLAALLFFTVSPLALLSTGDPLGDFAFDAAQSEVIRAAAVGDIAWFHALQRRAVDADECALTRDADGRTPLHWAASGNHISVARALLDGLQSVDVESLDGASESGASTAGGDTTLEQVLEARDNDGCTPLHAAAAAGRTELAELLLSRSADANAADAHGRTPLHHAAARGATACIDLLALHGALHARLDDAGRAPLHFAAYNGHHAAVAALLARGAACDARDADQRTPLMWAALSGNCATVNTLVNLGASLDAPDDYGKTPLHYAAGSAHGDVVRALLDAAAVFDDVDAHARSVGGGAANGAVTPATACDCAIGDPSDDPAPATLVVVHRASCPSRALQALVLRLVMARDHEGRVPLHDAAAVGAASTVALLLDRGADANAIDLHGRTPLHYAASCAGGTPAVAELLRRGATPDVRDADQLTPLVRAALAGHATTVDELRLREAQLAVDRDTDARRYHKSKSMVEALLRDNSALKTQLNAANRAPPPVDPCHCGANDVAELQRHVEAARSDALVAQQRADAAERRWRGDAAWLASLSGAELGEAELAVAGLLERVRAARVAQLTAAAALCSVCHTRAREVVLLPCRHSPFCWPCFAEKSTPRHAPGDDSHVLIDKLPLGGVACSICCTRSTDSIRVAL